MTEQTNYLVSNSATNTIEVDYNPNTLIGKEHGLPIMLPAGHAVTEVEMQLRNGQLTPASGYNLYVGVANPLTVSSNLPSNIDFAKFNVGVLNEVQHIQCLNNFNNETQPSDNSRIAFPQSLPLRIRSDVECTPDITGDVYVVVKHKPISVGPQVHVQSNELFMPTN